MKTAGKQLQTREAEASGWLFFYLTLINSTPATLRSKVPCSPTERRKAIVRKQQLLYLLPCSRCQSGSYWGLTCFEAPATRLSLERHGPVGKLATTTSHGSFLGLKLINRGMYNEHFVTNHDDNRDKPMRADLGSAFLSLAHTAIYKPSEPRH